MEEPFIACDNLVKIYKIADLETVALQGLDLVVPAGELMGIVGPSGKVYASADEPTEGYAVARIDLDEVRQCREETQIFQCRQPSAYRPVVKKY